MEGCAIKTLYELCCCYVLGHYSVQRLIIITFGHPHKAALHFVKLRSIRREPLYLSSNLLDWIITP